jgi:hypothetical protein
MIAHDTLLPRLTQRVGVARADSVSWLDLPGYLRAGPLEPERPVAQPLFALRVFEKGWLCAFVDRGEALRLACDRKIHTASPS